MTQTVGPLGAGIRDTSSGQMSSIIEHIRLYRMTPHRGNLNV